MEQSNDTEARLAKRLQALARGNSAGFLHLLTEFESAVTLDDTRTRLRTHFVTSGAPGYPVVEMLSEAMADAATDFCIPRSRIEEAQDELDKSGSTRGFTRLARDAAALFAPFEGTGEGGELLLFMLMESLLGLPQILAKMSLKTNSNVHVHGSDGVHAKFADDGVLDLYWGESKLKKSASDAFAECFSSIGPFLGESAERRSRDLMLVRDNINIADQHLAMEVLRYFNAADPKALNVRWNAVCLVGFEYQQYPILPAQMQLEAERIRTSLQSWKKMLAGRINGHSVKQINVDVYCIPLPDVEAFRKHTLRALGIK